MARIRKNPNMPNIRDIRLRPSATARHVRVIRGSFLLFLLWALVAEAAPDISADATNLSFGVITDDTNVTQRFTIRNRGDAPLRIARIKAGCACARAELNRMEIPAGGTAELTVE